MYVILHTVLKRLVVCTAACCDQRQQASALHPDPPAGENLLHGSQNTHVFTERWAGVLIITNTIKWAPEYILYV